MVEVLTRIEPIDSAPFEASGVALRLAPPALRYSVRARDTALLATLLGPNVPSRIGDTAGGIVRLGPDELLVLRAPDSPLDAPADLPASVTDVSERSVALIVEGPRAVELLCAGCPLDLERMAVGRAVRTIYETVEILVWRESADRFRVEVWRSLRALALAVALHGCRRRLSATASACSTRAP